MEESRLYFQSHHLFMVLTNWMCECMFFWPSTLAGHFSRYTLLAKSMCRVYTLLGRWWRPEMVQIQVATSGWSTSCCLPVVSKKSVHSNF